MKTLYIIILLLFIICIVYFAYTMLITKYFRKNNSISYTVFLKTFIQKVSKNNYFMNYGLWDDDTNNLINANKNLINFVFDKSELKNKTYMNILDIGCGYGEQDIEWSNKIDKTCKIIAIDISEEQIKHATSKNTNILFDVCDANNIKTKYNNELFNIIISLESAFHYPKRDIFFNDVNSLLTNDGKFIITDLMLKNSYNKSTISSLFIYFFSDFLCIPKQNLITADEWDNQLLSNFIVEESIDITEKTFKPYYMHFMNTYVKNKNWPTYIGDKLSYFFCENQPFSYKVAICKKKPI